MSKQLKADLLLLTVTLCWGVSYLMMDRCLEQIGAFTLNAWRFLLAFAVALAVSFRRTGHPNRATLRAALLLGTVLTVVYAGATFGVQYTTLSNSGFLCGLSTILTPVFGCIVYKKLPSRKLILCVLLCFCGTALLIGLDGLRLSSATARGDLLCASCGVSYSFHMLITERAVRDERIDPFALGVWQLLFCGAWNLLLSVTTEGFAAPRDGGTWAMMLFLSIFCTGLAFIGQTLAQRHTSATHTGLIFSLEQVFSAITAYIFVREVLAVRAYFGAALMVCSVLMMELLPERRRA